jgi:cellulose synthase (UDP-forming)
LFETLGYDPNIVAATPGLVTCGAFLAATALFPDPRGALRPFFFIVSAVLLCRYMIWRVTVSMPEASYTLDYALAVFFLATELLGFVAALLSLFFLSRTRDRSATADSNAAWLENESGFPLVDVLICSYNEERAILERTIVGAKAMQYPNFRVWMLDNSRRPWLKALCAELGCEYLDRPTNEHAKAGNINNALQVLSALERKPDFVAILDADFVPTRRFVKRALTLFRDPNVALVQTPQHFINPDPIQINLRATAFWPDEQRMFFDCVMASKDAWGAAFCCGTSSIIRFDPLIAIGGFPTDSVTEDYLVTLRLKENGGLTAYLNEPLTFGLAPEGLKEYVTQRARWCLGFMQIARGRSGPFSRTSQLAALDRLSLIDAFMAWTAVYLSRAIMLLLPVVALAFDLHPFQATTGDLMREFAPYYLWHGLTTHWISAGRSTPVLSDIGQFIVMPQILRACVAGLLRPVGQKFQVTAKGGDRSKRFVEWGLMRPFLALIAFTVAVIVRTFYFDDRADVVAHAGPALFWCWYNLTALTLVCFVCVEQPRHRAAERFESHEIAKVHSAQADRTVQLVDLSLTGAKIAGAPPGKVGEPVQLDFDDLSVDGVIVRVEAHAYAVAFSQDPATRAAMIRRFYGHDYVKPIGEIRLLRVGNAIVSRVLQ